METGTEIAAASDGPAPQPGGEPQPYSLEQELAAQHAANGSSAAEHNA
jgi:hypothetical protein